MSTFEQALGLVQIAIATWLATDTVWLLGRRLGHLARKAA